MTRIDIYNVNAIVSAVESAREDVSATNGECLVAFTELIRQTLELVDADLRPDFHRAIAHAICADDAQILADWLLNPRVGASA